MFHSITCGLLHKGIFETAFKSAEGEVTCNSHIRRCLFPGKTLFSVSEQSFEFIFCFQCFHRKKKINHEVYHSSFQSFLQLGSSIIKIKYSKPFTGSVTSNWLFSLLLITIGGVWNFLAHIHRGTCPSKSLKKMVILNSNVTGTNDFLTTKRKILCLHCTFQFLLLKNILNFSFKKLNYIYQ